MPQDPYRWMEADTPALKAWMREQHAHTIAELSAVPARADIHRRLAALLRTPALGNIAKSGNRYFFRQRPPGRELSALYCCDMPHGEARLLLDPNELSFDHT